VLFREEGRCLAYEVGAGTEIELGGMLSDLAANAPGRLAALDPGNLKLVELARALLAGPRLPRLQELLAPQGFGKLFVELTGRCNERCLHCYASSSPEVQAELDLDTILRVIQEAKRIGFRVIQFTGGDPLISKHVRDATARAATLGFEQIEVYTNGLAFSTELARHFKAHGVSMALSVYSHRPEVHDAVTGTYESHRRTLRAIELAVGHSIPLRVSVIVRDENQHDTDLVRKMVMELGVPAHHVGADRERPVGRGKWQDDAALPDEELFSAHAPGEVADPGGKLAVTYDGHVVPCVFDRSTLLGNVRESSLEQILSQPIRIRELPHRTLALFPQVGEPLACTDCQERRNILSRVDWTSNA